MRGKIDKLSGLVVVTGASSGIGLELAKCAARDGVALILAADRDLSQATAEIEACGPASVETLECNLATDEGIDRLIETIGDRQVDALIANAGHGLGGEFLDEEWSEARHVLDTNVTGTIHLIHRIGRQMRQRDEGRILVTGSIAGHMPGSFQLVYNSTKAFLDDFCIGLRNELKNTGVAVTVLEPGATETRFFERAELMDTQVGQAKKADPAKVAQDGYAAMLADDDQVVSGMMNKLRAFAGDILPDELVAQIHRRMAEPESHKHIEQAREAENA